MSTPYRQSAKYKLTENYHPYYPKNPNFDYTGNQDFSQNAAVGLYYENLVGHILINKLVNKVIGKGLTPMSAPDVSFLGWTKEQGRKFSSQAESLYRLLCNDQTIDWNGKDTILQLQRKALRMIFISGDVLLHIGYHKRGGVVVPYIQLINGRLIANPGATLDSKNLVGGVYLNDAGKEIGYSILEFGRNLEDTMSYKKVNKYNTKTGRMDFDLITIDQPESGMIRGVPLLTVLMDDILQTGKFKEVHLTKAIIQSLFSVAIEKQETDNPEEIPSFKERIAGSLAADQSQVEAVMEDNQPITLGSGQVVDLEPGEKMVPVETAMQSDDYVATMEMYLSLIAAGVGLSYEELLGKYNSSFSASKATINSSEKNYKTLRDEFERKFLNPIWRSIIEYGVLIGAIDAPGYFDSELNRRAMCEVTWAGVTPTQVDPVKEVSSFKEAVQNNFCTAEYASRSLFGMDYEEVIQRRAEEKAMAEAAGLIPAAGASVNTEKDTEEPEGE